MNSIRKIFGVIVELTEDDYNYSKKLVDGTYFELSKNEIEQYFFELKSVFNQWQLDLNNNDITNIVDEYKKYESIISELELCLLDNEEFEISKLSLLYFEFGKELITYLNKKTR